MNIVLLRLLEYLGHTNPFISGVAYTEVNGSSIDLKLLLIFEAIEVGPASRTDSSSAFSAILENLVRAGDKKSASSSSHGRFALRFNWDEG